MYPFGSAIESARSWFFRSLRSCCVGFYVAVWPPERSPWQQKHRGGNKMGIRRLKWWMDGEIKQCEVWYLYRPIYDVISSCLLHCWQPVDIILNDGHLKWFRVGFMAKCEWCFYETASFPCPGSFAHRLCKNIFTVPGKRRLKAFWSTHLFTTARN